MNYRNIRLPSSRILEWGKQGENKATRLSVDVSEFIKPSEGTIAVSCCRPDGKKYPHDCTINDTTVEIELSSYDTQVCGILTIVVSWMCGERIVKSEIYCGEISRSISTSGEKPTPPFDGLIEQVNNAAIKAKESADRAEAAAERAENAAGSGGGIVEETDPTVPDWAKQPEKPAYTAQEVGARPVDWLPTPNEIGAQPAGNYALKSEIPNVPVQSVNGQTGNVQLEIPQTYELPTASASVKGGVRIGKGLAMDVDVLEAEVQKEDIDNLSEEKVDKVLFDEVFEIHEASPNLYVPQSEGWTDNAFITTGGYPTVDDSKYKSYCVTPLIPIESGTYTITPSPVTVGTADKNVARFYNAEGTVLSGGTLRKSEEAITFEVPFGASYVRFSVLKESFGGDSVDIDAIVNNFNTRVMIVKGETIPSEYVPYYPARNAMKNIAIPDKSVTLKTIGDDAAPIISPLMGKKIANFGDSIFGNARPPLDVSTFLAENTGASVYNCAFGGCRMSHHVGHWDAFSMYRLAYAIANNDYSLQDEAINHDDRTSYAEEPLTLMKTIDYSGLDILTIGYGTNDYTGNVTIDNAENPLDTSTLCGALRYSIETLLTAYPNLRIFVLLPTYRFWVDPHNAYVDDAFDHVNDIGKTLVEYNDAIAETAKAYNIPVIDNFAELGINKYNRYQYFNETDGTHHNENGRKLLAEHLADKLW